MIYLVADIHQSLHIYILCTPCLDYFPCNQCQSIGVNVCTYCFGHFPVVRIANSKREEIPTILPGSRLFDIKRKRLLLGISDCIM